MTKNNDIVSLDNARQDRIRRELEKHGKLPCAYLCTKYGSQTFIEMLTEGHLKMNDHALVSLKDEE